MAANFWSRVAAYLIDLVAITLVLLALQWIGDAVVPSTSRDPMVQGLVGWGTLVAYFPLFWWSVGATPGMSLLGLRLVGADTAGLPIRRLVSRYIAWVVVHVVVLGVPFAFIFFIVNRVRRRPLWHDVVSGTRIVSVRSASPTHASGFMDRTGGDHREARVPVIVNAAPAAARPTRTADHPEATAASGIPTTELGREMRRLNEAAIAGMNERLADAGSASALGFCGNCGRPRDEASSKFCRYCGTPLPAS